MKTICFNFNIHRAYRLKKYDFFDIGHNNFYFDELGTQTGAEKKNSEFVLPMFDMVESLTEKYGSKFKFSVTVSGIALSIQEKYCPEIIKRYQNLVETGCVEFVGMPYNHSLCALTDEEEFVRQVKKHKSVLQRLIGVTPTTFRNTELIYTDKIGKAAYDLGFDTVLAEGVGPGLDSRGAGFLYFNPLQPRQHVITRNVSISRILHDSLKDISLFTPEYFANKLCEISLEEDEIIYMGISFEHMDGSSGNRKQVPAFLKETIEKVMESGTFKFRTMSEASHKYEPVAPYHASQPVSGMKRKHDLSPWQGNELQKEALRKITALGKLVKASDNEILADIWERLQCSDYFYFMSTDKLDYKTNPFKTPYDAFISYMNIIDDLTRRLDQSIEKNKAANMTDQQIKDVISLYEKEIVSLRRKLAGKGK
ncbi:MAG: hypothetical protein J6X05_06905 [Bacteroidales bacterium]|nr:hypothetical protein [Bacteroidales bacterium]